MGWKRLGTGPEANLYNYGASWNDLMLVVQKIDSLMPPINLIDDEGSSVARHYIEVTLLPICTPLSEVRQKVVEFVRWYEQQESQRL
ncbi:MAG TPA: hypothetical protein VMU29_14940 [Smithella sp.]|nr:hypothetical protein [Smithella sp.]